MDIVSFDRIRSLSVKCIPLKQGQFKHTEIVVPEDLRIYFKRPETCSDFASIVKNVYIEYKEESGHLHISVIFFLIYKLLIS